MTVDEILHQSRTEFQGVLIFRNRSFGKVLVLDGAVQLTERDSHIYREVIAHVPLFAHWQAKRVLVVGGGDGGFLKEVRKRPVSKVVLPELDDEVIDLSREYFRVPHDPALKRGPTPRIRTLRGIPPSSALFRIRSSTLRCPGRRSSTALRQ